MIYQHNTGLDFRPFFIYANYPPPESKLRLCIITSFGFENICRNFETHDLCLNHVVEEVPGRVCSSEGGAPQGMMSPRVFPNLRRMNKKYGNLLSPHKNKLSFHFSASLLWQNIFIGTWEHMV